MRLHNLNITLKKIGIVLFPRFETLDVFGPVEMWGHMPDYEIAMVSEHGEAVVSSQGVETVAKYSFEDAPQFEILLVPGGIGTRVEVYNSVLLEFIRQQDQQTEWTTSVCTGSGILAKTGILDGRKATTNKQAQPYAWATSQSTAVMWQSRARWVVDGKYVTSSGVTAGTDMALGLIEIIHGKQTAEQIATYAEYVWNSDPHNDPFEIDENEAG